MASSPFYLLPNPLLLLVHLHLLEYPNANNPEYDENLFNPQMRGLRDRTKTMEDISYFLVGRIVGSPKTVFPSYPCSLPADTTNFRSALTKSLESLRHPPGEPWWWRDVVVRKSLLEECAGERFERIMLSLSTHALIKGSHAAVDSVNGSTILQEVQHRYTSSLSSAKNMRKISDQAASALAQRRADLKALVEHIKAESEASTSPFTAFTTPRLDILAKTQLEDLLVRNGWGEETLGFLARILNLKSEGSSNIIPVPAPTTQTEIALQPLPIAAAHHPSSIRRLHVSVFASERKRAKPMSASVRRSVAPSDRSTPHTFNSPVLLERTGAEMRLHRELETALAHMKSAQSELDSRLSALQSQLPPQPLLEAGLWDENFGVMIDFEVTPTFEELATMGLYNPPSDTVLEDRIDEIRATVLSQYPPTPAIRPASPDILPQSALPAFPEAKAPPTPTTVRRKSVRKSLVLARRPSLFPKVASLPEDDEIHKIINSISDGDKSDEDPEFMTPRAKPGARFISTTKISTVRRPGTALRQSFALPVLATPLPSLDFDEVDSPSHEDEAIDVSVMGMGDYEQQEMLMDDQGFSMVNGQWMEDDDDDDENDYEQEMFAAREGAESEGTEEEDSQYEGKSMTLRNILLRSVGDTSHFDLLDDDPELDDTSFDWE